MLYVILIRVVIANLGLSVIAKAYLQSSPLEYLVAVILAFGLLHLYRDYKIKQLELQGDIEYVALIKPVVVILRIIIATTAACGPIRRATTCRRSSPVSAWVP